MAVFTVVLAVAVFTVVLAVAVFTVVLAVAGFTVVLAVARAFAYYSKLNRLCGQIGTPYVQC